jgi:CRISPR type III-A/MTUBE-associated protein Csm2
MSHYGRDSSRSGGAAAGRSLPPTFDPSKPKAELLDALAEEQAKALSINSSQLRRFFGEVKDLYRQYETKCAAAPRSEWEDLYRQDIEPRFKLVRSKVAYAKGRQGGSKLPADFASFLDAGIKKVRTGEEFRLFVQHFEAVVGFMYGLDQVR